jgi:hypothetical protein
VLLRCSAAVFLSVAVLRFIGLLEFVEFIESTDFIGFVEFVGFTLCCELPVSCYELTVRGWRFEVGGNEIRCYGVAVL